MPRPNKGAYLERNKFGVWEIRWTENRRSRGRSTGCQDLEDAQRVLGAFLLGKARQQGKKDGLLVREVLGDPGDPGKPTLATYWHSYVLVNVVGLDTQRYAVEKLLQHFGNIEVAEVSQVDADAYVEKRMSGAIGRPSKPATARRELGVLVAAVNWAVRAKRIDRRDALMLDLPPDSDPKDRWLTHDEADRLEAAAAATPRTYAFVRLALATAARQGSIRRLQWRYVDLDRGLVRYDLLPGKRTKKRRVAVPLTKGLLPALRIAQEGPDDFVLRHGGSIRQAFATACAAAGLTDVTPHTLRHTWATWAAQQGKTMWEIAGVLGDTVETVTRRYAHHCPEHLRDAVDIQRPTPRNEPRNAQRSVLKSSDNSQQIPEKVKRAS